MSSDKSSSNSSGIGFPGLLTIAFVVLKLCGIINWSWWWVVSPIWITIALGLGFIVMYLAWCAAMRR